MLKKHHGILLAAIVFVMMFSLTSLAERVLPEKTNAYEDHNPQKGLTWLSDQTLAEKMVASAKNAYKGDESLFTLAKNSIIIHSQKTYGYVNGFRTNMAEGEAAYPAVIDGRTYVPLKFAGLSLSGSATFNEATGMVEIVSGGKTANCTPLIQGENVYVPVRSLYGDILGMEVIYAGRGAVLVTTSQYKALATEDILLKLSDPDFYIEREKMVHPSDAIRWTISDSNGRAMSTQGLSVVKSSMNSYLSSASMAQGYITDNNLSEKYPVGKRSLSNLLTMDYRELADYVDYSAWNYCYTSGDTQLKRPRHIGERASYERAAAYLGRIYELNSDEDAALRTIIMLYHTALRFDSLDASYRTDNTFYNYAYVTPYYLVYAYDKVYHSPMWEAFKSGYGTDARDVVENYFRAIYNYICANYKGSKVISNYPLIMEHTAGLGIALDDPDIMRFVMERLNSAVSPMVFYADGMWYEGSVDYGSQMVGHAYYAARIVKEYRDRRCYTDDIFNINIKLDGKQDVKGRWTAFFDYVDSLKVDSGNFLDTAFAYPDGSPLTLNDVHWQTPSSNVANSSVKINDFSKNLEYNHFGLYGLRYGNKEEAQQLNLSVQATTGVSHQHSSYLAMSYYSGGMELLPDIGYATADMGSNRYMATASYCHNIASAFESTGKSSTDDGVGAFFARPNIYAYDDGSTNGKQIQLIEGSNLMPNCVTSNFAYDYGIDVNRRMLLMIATDENHSYVVDVHRIKGSQVRESYLISSQDEDTTLTTDIRSQENYTGKLIEWLRNSKGKVGGTLLSANTLYSGKLVNPIGSTSSDDFKFTWQGATASLNAFVKGNENSVTAFSQIPAVRRLETNSSAKANHFYRRVDVPEESDEVTTFASVYEGVKNGSEAKISDVTWIYTGNDMTTSLIVKHASGLCDYIYISGDTQERNLGDYKMSGAVCILRADSAGNVIYSYVYGNGAIKNRKTAKTLITGKADISLNVVASYGNGQNELVLSDTLPDYAKGIWGSVNFNDGSGTAFKVNGINGNTIGVNNDPGFYMEGENAVFTAYPMYEDTSKPGRIADWATAYPKSGTVSQRTRTDVTFTLKVPTFINN